MADGQLDLFAGAGAAAEERAGAREAPCARAVGRLDDAALVAALPGAGLAEAPALAAEAGRRRLAAAVPALERLCLRFAGFGLERAIPEQIAALDALARTGAKAAAQAVARLIVRGAVQGPNRKAALGVAAALRASLPTAVLCALLQDADPELRAHACRCTGAATPAGPRRGRARGPGADRPSARPADRRRHDGRARHVLVRLCHKALQNMKFLQ
jgi:hypothetical protein